MASTSMTSSSRSCGENSLGQRYYCIPRLFKPTASFLFHNNGDGTFRELREGTDIAKSLGKGLGVVATDINNDGRLDLFVANDTVQNFLYANRGPGTSGKWRFEEVALPAEVAFSAEGQPRSGMGVDAADFDRLPKASENEEDMLDLAAGATRTSRLSCQIWLDAALDGLTVRIPGEARNMQGS